MASTATYPAAEAATDHRPPPHLDAAARALAAILNRREPDRSWTVRPS